MAPALESQQARVLRELRAAGKYGVCSESWYQSAVPNARNHVSTLRAAGHHIDTLICDEQHGPVYRRYLWRHGPGERCSACIRTPEQQELALEATS